MTLHKEEKTLPSGVIHCCQGSDNSSDLSISEAAEDATPTTTTTTTSTSGSNLTHYQNIYDSVDVNFPRREEVDIEFQNIRYNVRRFSFNERKFVTKEILHGINGAFRSGELTAIMGPSGSGKSTLLNVMTGFKSTGVTGTVKVNGKVQSTNADSFRRLSCYIHQDDLVRPMMTVGETMMITAHLKLGYKVTTEYKVNLVKKILILLGLDNRFNTYTAKLSGGQKKRLAIALELICNPPVLYLDEPTTGLDSSSCVQCVALLKILAKQGHTVVCTIHQPSALLFEMFDKLYTVADGNCIYQGAIKELVPFLADQGLSCPSYHNPADYLMEVAVGEHERDINKLIHSANKKYYEDGDLYQLIKISSLINTIHESQEARQAEAEKYLQTYEFGQSKSMADDQCEKGTELAELRPTKKGEKAAFDMEKLIESAPVYMQFFLLLRRILIGARRNYFLLIARIMSHVIIGIIFGYLYQNVGQKATTVLGNYVYLYGTILLLVYTGKMAVVLSFPLEIDMLKREHFNRWYKLGPYFIAMISFEIPFQAMCASLYLGISYYLTGNYETDAFRLYYFMLLGILATLSAQAWGFFVGATMPTKIAVFIGPILAVLFSVFGFCTRYIDITPLFRWMWHISYFRAGFHGVLNVIYGMNRPFLECPKTAMYCHFKSPKVFLNYMMISDVTFFDTVGLMGIVIVTMHSLTVLALWYKLTKR